MYIRGDNKLKSKKIVILIIIITITSYILLGFTPIGANVTYAADKAAGTLDPSIDVIDDGQKVRFACILGRFFVHNIWKNTNFLVSLQVINHKYFSNERRSSWKQKSTPLPCRATTKSAGTARARWRLPACDSWQRKT